MQPHKLQLKQDMVAILKPLQWNMCKLSKHTTAVSNNLVQSTVTMQQLSTNSATQMHKLHQTSWQRAVASTKIGQASSPPRAQTIILQTTKSYSHNESNMATTLKHPQCNTTHHNSTINLFRATMRGLMEGTTITWVDAMDVALDKVTPVQAEVKPSEQKILVDAFTINRCTWTLQNP